MTSEPTSTPFGSWPSPITAELIVQASVGLGGPAHAGGDLWWSELRPTEAGRVQVVRKRIEAPSDEPGAEVLPEGFSARTRVHEYGGGAWWLHAAAGDGEPGGDVTLFFANWGDQRLYRIDRAGTDDAGDPVAITPAQADPDEPHAFRFADGVVTADGDWVVCVREWHGAPRATEARNEIVAVPADGSADPTVLVGVTIDRDGPDFVSSPRLSPDGRTLAWLQWHHPDMPWDATELLVAELDEGSWSATPSLTGRTVVAGGPGESVTEPQWDEDGRLHFVSDRRGRHEIFRTEEPWRAGQASSGETPVEVAVEMVAGADSGEYGKPMWVFGQTSYLPMQGEERDGAQWWSGRRATVYRTDGRDLLTADLRPRSGSFVLDHYTAVDGLTFTDDGLAVLGGTFATEPSIATLRLRPGGDSFDDLEVRVNRPPRDLGIDGHAWFSAPDHIEFPTTPNADGSDATAHALFYPPKNPDHVGPPGQAPPLLVMSHGGPTSAARAQLQLGVQFWTSRGVAVVDVNYRGSTGYGRAYRDALRDRWGIADVDDCIAAARFLAAAGRVDGARLAIRGGSAGGYTTLCALTFHDDFTVGTSLYGVADLEALATDTHKFESRYLDSLVGPYPEARQTYLDRSPIHHVDQLRTPLLILQGLEDEIVPPAQAQMMADALAAKGVAHAYLTFEGEQHGFRQAPNIRRALEAELYFYSRIFGFDLAERIEPVPITGAVAPAPTTPGEGPAGG